MTTNQTIDGVPRRICHACVTFPRKAYCPVCDDEPSAQPQGEPVAWRSCAAINGKHYITEDSPDQQQERIDKSDPGAYLLASQPLYLGPPEQPAPVAVVLPERLAMTGRGLMDAPTVNHHLGWNACLDELKRLNTK